MRRYLRALGSMAMLACTTVLQAQVEPLPENQVSGIGFEFQRPQLGQYAGADKLWTGISILGDIYEFRFVQGRAGVWPGEYGGFSDERPPAPDTFGESHSGFELSAGVLVPIMEPWLDLPFVQVQPAVGLNLGLYRLKPLPSLRNNGDNSYYYLGVKPAIQVNVPFLTVEASLNGRAGITSTHFDRSLRGLTLQPALALRFDALKEDLNPLGRSMRAQQVRVSNAKSESRTYRSGDRVITQTTNSATVTTTNSSRSFQDIGDFLGLGPVYSFGSARRRSYTPVSQLAGLNLAYKPDWGNLGLTLEGGKFGHAQANGGRKGKDLETDLVDGRGTYTGAQLYTDIGLDISSYALGLLGIVSDISEGTQFFSLAAGFTQGVAFLGNQQFENPDFGEQQADAFYARQGDKFSRGEDPLEPHQYDPRAAQVSHISGWWIGMDVGVVAFRMRRLNYARARLARNITYSLAYRVPLGSR